MSSIQEQFDVAIIGGGLIGLCSAWYLHQQGYTVAVVDKGEIGGGSSSQNAGMIVPSHFIPLAAPGVIQQGLGWMLNSSSPFYIKPRLSLDLGRWLWKFARTSTQAHVDRSMPLLLDMHMQSRALFEQFATAEKLAFGFEKNGILMLYRTPKGQAECHELMEAAAKLDLPVDMLSTAEASERLSGLGLTVMGGTWLPQDAHLNPQQLIATLHTYLANAGVTFFTNSEVVGFATSNNQIKQLVLTDRTLASREVVLASGAWSPRVARGLGLNVPIQAAKGYSFMVPRLAGKLDIPLLLAEAKVAITPLAQGVRFAGTLEMTGIDLSINQRRVQTIQNAPPKYIPEFEVGDQEVAAQEVWVGMRPLTPDGLPMIGRSSKFSNLILATGHGMMGVSLAPITGKVVGEIIAGNSPSIELSLLRADRF